MEKQSTSIIIYKDARGNVELKADIRRKTIWATQAQIAKLFGTQRPAITKHLNNIFKSGELSEKSVCSILEHTASDGKVYKTQYYNLDAIISVGYRVNSNQATHFRIWATKTIRDFILKGYVINAKRLKESQAASVKELKRTFGLIQSAIHKRQLSQTEIDGLLSVISTYANSWALLQKYDEGKLGAYKGKTKPSRRIEYDFVQKAIAKLKVTLIARHQASDLFGKERDSALQGILTGIYQTFGGKELYATVEEKAAHLLYFVIKDHPFSDGNKRIGSLLFVTFLNMNAILLRSNGELKISDNTLAVLALLIAESDPKDKSIMTSLVINLLI